MKRTIMNFGLMVTVSFVMYGCVSEPSAPQTTTSPTVSSTPQGSADTTPSKAVETSDATKTDTEGTQTFTLEELAKHNGKDGNKAYIAIDGIVYDVTDLKGWSNGAHNGFEAGKDLTEAANSTSGTSAEKPSNMPADIPSLKTVLSRSKVVGILEGTQTFTVEDLAKYNGKDGNKAYIAMDGIVYDVTDLYGWSNGAHNGFEAGKDLTEAANGTSGTPAEKPSNMPADIPSLKTVLSRAKVVGVLKAAN